MNTRTPSLVAAASLGLLATPALAQDLTRTVEYTVKKGDTCWAIAKKLYGDPWKYRSIKTKSQTCPDVIVPGQILLLPHPDEVAKLPDARVDRARGDVTARAPEDDWSRAERGLDLWRAWKVNAADDSAARIGFTANGGRLELRENTLVVIYGPREARVGAARRATASAELERGTLRARLGELAGEDVTVKTPAAQADMGGGGDVLVAVDVRGTTRVSNHDGGKVEVSSRPRKKKKKKTKRKKVAVPKNMGSKVEQGKEPTPPQPLPDAPRWAQSQGVDVVRLGDEGTSARVAWAPVDGAVAYTIALTSDEAGEESVDRVDVPGAADAADFRDLPPGTYWLRAATLDADGFESRPSDPTRLSVHELALERPHEGSLRLTDAVVAPDGVLCSTGGEYASRVLLDRAGAFELTCKVGDREVTALPVEVAAPTLGFPAQGDGGGILEGVAGAANTFVIETSYPLTGLTAVGEGVEVLGVTPADDSGLRWNLEVASAAPTAGKVRLEANGAPVTSLPVIIRAGEGGEAADGGGVFVAAHGGWAALAGEAEPVDGLGALSWEAGAAVGYRVSENLTLTGDLGALGLGGAAAFAPQVGAQLTFPLAVEPILGVGVGGAMTFAGGVAFAPMLSGHLGARAPLTDALSLRAQLDGRSIFDPVGDPTRHLGASLWMEWNLD
jgi:LysM repeat protein